MNVPQIHLELPHSSSRGVEGTFYCLLIILFIVFFIQHPKRKPCTLQSTMYFILCSTEEIVIYYNFRGKVGCIGLIT